MDIRRATTQDAGSCNACGTRATEFVYDFSLNYLSFRLCPKCVTEMEDKLFILKRYYEQNNQR